MPRYVVDRIADALNDRGKSVRGSRIHILGVSYKRDVADVRESPALDILHLLGEKGAQLSYTDPWVPELREPGFEFKSEPLSTLAEKDCVVIVTDHRSFDYPAIVRDAPLIVDTRNALGQFREKKIYRL
jgi:UDP-N-acetyl-D-glucosamine dehydrogenase